MNKFLNNHAQRFILVFILGLLAVIYFTGLTSPIRGDAVRYAAIAQEIVNTNEFLALQNRGGIPYLQQGKRI